MTQLLTPPLAPLIIAVLNGNIEYTSELLQNGVDVDVRDQNGNSALHIAASKGYKKIAEMLLLYGATIDAPNFELATPLHYAAANNYKDLTQYLLNMNANKSAVNKYNQSPQDFARLFNSHEVIPILCEADSSVCSTPQQSQIVLSYNIDIGGATALSIMTELATSHKTKIVMADYLKIVPTIGNTNSLFMYIYDDIKQCTYISFSVPETLKIFSEAKNNALKALEDSDGLIIPGNVNMLDARLFGEAISPDDIQSQHNLERNIAEMALIHVATQRGIPILGICGGHQILNTYFGGKVGHKSDDHNSYVNIIPDSELSQIIFGKPNMSIEKEKFWEAHQQVVKEIGGTNHINGKHDLFKAVAYTNDDIEAVESQFGAFIMGLQFHPEMSTYSNAFTCSEKARDKKIYLAFQQSVRSFHNKQVFLAEFKNSKHYSKTQHPTGDITEKLINYESNKYNNNIIDMFNATYSNNNNSFEIIGCTNVEILD